MLKWKGRSGSGGGGGGGAGEGVRRVKNANYLFKRRVVKELNEAPCHKTFYDRNLQMFLNS